MTNPTIPVLSIKGATYRLYQTGSDRDLARAFAYEAGQLHANYAAGEAAAALRELFGDTAHRAVFETIVGDGTDATLLVVFDRDDTVLWYNRDTDITGTEIADERDARDEPMPDIEPETLRYIEGLVEWAEEEHHDGFLLAIDLVINPSKVSPGWHGGGLYQDETTVELPIGDALATRDRVIGDPTSDGATRPQRTALSPAAREVAVLTLQRVLAKQGQMHRIPLTGEEKKLLGEVIASLDPH